jgi:tetratricopeptide (TPR) repeat protein
LTGQTSAGIQMNINLRAFRSFALTLLLSSSLLGCGGLNQWGPLYTAGKNLDKAGDVNGAVKKYYAAVTFAEQNQVPKQEYYDAVLALGRLLLKQGKDGEAITYLVRALQIGGATGMTLQENISILHELARAEAHVHDWEEAAGTEKTLITLLEVEKSPFTPELVEERKFNQQVTEKLISYRKNRWPLASTAVPKTN